MEDKVREVARGMPAERGVEGERGRGERVEERGGRRGEAREVEQISSRTYMHVNMTAILEFVRSKFSTDNES